MNPEPWNAVPPLYIHPRTMVTRRICAVVPQPMGLDRNWPDAAMARRPHTSALTPHPTAAYYR
jgi:hypothetical protein